MIHKPQVKKDVRHLVDARTDQYNNELHNRIEQLLAPRGYQPSPKHGSVSITQVITKRMVDDFSYAMIKEVVKLKIDQLVYLRDQIRSCDKRMAQLSDRINSRSKHGALRWFRKQHSEHRADVSTRATVLVRLAGLHDMRMHVDKHGPAIDEEIKAKFEI